MNKMKKFIIVVFILVLLYYVGDYMYYSMGFYIDWHPDQKVTTETTTDEEKIYLKKDGKFVPFEPRGMNLGLGSPGHWATDYSVDTDTYMRWFREIQDMGCNTIRVYTILHNSFYDAFYEYNKNNDNPLYLIHGVWVDDYTLYSRLDGFDKRFMGKLMDDCRTVVDIIHGKKDFSLGRVQGSGHYRKDISPWVLGYIVGVEWDDTTVAYTDHKYPERVSYQGTYMYTDEKASPFERMLCEVGDRMIAYESERYKEQRLLAFSNWATTDPFEYGEKIRELFRKCASVDVEHIHITDAFLSGQFASYHIYPYYPDYLDLVEDKSGFCRTPDGRINTYRTYLKRIKEHHTMPVVVSEYGVSTGRGMAQVDRNTQRNQGHMSEKQQGQAIIDCYKDIKSVGCAGCFIFTWQDEWFKRTWNTMHAVDLQKTPWWSDYQTNEQYFGMLSFDPGDEKSICYVDGDFSEWSKKDKVITEKDLTLSIKYDEKFIYFLIQKPGLNPEEDRICIPIDTTPKTGSTYCENEDISFEKPADFLMLLHGKDDSRILVQERYECLRAMYLSEIEGKDPYVHEVDQDTPVFKEIRLILRVFDEDLNHSGFSGAETYETGKLLYGNANPDSPEYNSLADFCFGKDGIEVKVPWQLLNFSNPAEMMIHDDYYEHYGVEQIQIDHMNVGICEKAEAGYRVPMKAYALKGWERNIKFHERLKPSYYQVKNYWERLDQGKETIEPEK